jgi:hypothetical protein
MSANSSVHWKEIFMQAANETDKQKLDRLVREAELAIGLRRAELEDYAAAREELSTMAVATEALRAIRSQQLSGD